MDAIACEAQSGHLQYLQRKPNQGFVVAIQRSKSIAPIMLNTNVDNTGRSNGTARAKIRGVGYMRGNGNRRIRLVSITVLPHSEMERTHHSLGSKALLFFTFGHAGDQDGRQALNNRKTRRTIATLIISGASNLLAIHP